MPLIIRKSRLTLWAAALLALSAGSRKTLPADGPSHLSWDIDTESRFIGEAKVRGGDRHVGDFDEWSTDLKLVLAPQPTRDLLLRFGAEWQRFAFGVPSHAPVPPVLQKISANFGLDYQLTDKWLVRAQIQPGIYSDLQDVNWRDVDVPLLVGAAYLVNADLQWFFGVYIDPRSRYPALPAPGVRWRFADRWTLNLLYPNPRLEWDLTDKLKPYLGFGIDLGTFTVGDHFGDDRGRPDLNRAPLDYSEFRIGPGFSWKIWRQFTIDAEAGYMVHRRIDFFDQHLTFRSDPAPFVQIAGHVRF